MKAVRCIFICLAWLAVVVSSQGQSPVITVHPQDVTTCAGSNATFSVEVTGTPPINFIWHWNGVPVFSGVVSSQTNSTLTLTNVQFADDNTPVYVLVNGIIPPFAQSSNVYLHVPDPHICGEPQDVAVTNGGTIHFQVDATGTPPLTHQWWFQAVGQSNGVALVDDARTTGATAAQLSISNAAPADVGSYWVTVNNWLFNSVTSRVASCSLGNPPDIGNVPSRIVRIFTGTTFAPAYTGSLPRYYQWYQNDVAILNATNQSLLRTNIQRPEVGLYHVVASNAFGVATSVKGHLQVRISLEGTTPVFREEATDEKQNLTNAVKASFGPPPTAIFHGVPLLFTTYGATAAGGEASRCGVPASHSMWVLYTASRTEPTLVSTEGSDFDTVAAVYTWDNNPSHDPTELICDDNGGYDGQDSRLFFPATNGANYYIAVDGVGGATGTVRLQVGESIRKAKFNPANNRYTFEWTGPYWYENRLHEATNLILPAVNWTTAITMPATNRDWIIGYTNSSVLLDRARFYSTSINTNSTPP